jgi:UDP-N-acetylglucosamine 1-carboxyvinyltransferase
MDKLLIQGGQSLSGSVKISGAKNSVLPMLCASVMPSEGVVELENVPHLQDVTTTTRIINTNGRKR